MPNTVKWNDKEAENVSDQVNLFNDYFKSVLPEPIDSATGICQSDNVCENENLQNVTITEENLLCILKDLDTTKAIGPDNISPVFLKECRNEVKESLCILFNKSFSDGICPSEWKQANIVPVYKGKDAKDVSNYRPISLLSVVSKLAERCLYNHIYPHISDLLCKSQHGFLKGKSTCTQLVQFIDSVSDSLDNGIQTYIIYMDF